MGSRVGAFVGLEGPNCVRIGDTRVENVVDVEEQLGADSGAY